MKLHYKNLEFVIILLVIILATSNHTNNNSIQLGAIRNCRLFGGFGYIVQAILCIMCISVLICILFNNISQKI